MITCFENPLYSRLSTPSLSPLKIELTMVFKSWGSTGITNGCCRSNEMAEYCRILCVSSFCVVMMYSEGVGQI
jgi:hypothetical protein